MWQEESALFLKTGWSMNDFDYNRDDRITDVREVSVVSV